MTIIRVRPEVPSDRRNWLKPWVTWREERVDRYLAKHGSPIDLTVKPARGLIHDPSKKERKNKRHRAAQSKDRR